MTNDRELLELAAKAAGHTLIWGEKYKLGEDLVDCTDLAYIRSGQPDEGDLYWNPLTDDGDALRLAVKLRMVVDTDYNGGANAGNAAVDFGEPEYGYQEGQGKTDHFAATRRAIVRAAAEIGKGTKPFPTAKEIREEWT